MNKHWFESWFDSPYYHILYKHRDMEEAEEFLSNLIQQLGMPSGATVLDIACGRGRHAIYLNERGFDVTGFDLSEQNIAYDKQFENKDLHFYVHDMRSVFCVNYFDYVLNLFSSFGYFKSRHENEKALKANASALRRGGTFVFDYLNSYKIRNCSSAEAENETEIDGIKFYSRKVIKDDFVIKEIRFTHDGKDYFFTEQVRLFSLDELSAMFDRAGLDIMDKFGDYDLHSFDENNSPRLILIARKRKAEG